MGETSHETILESLFDGVYHVDGDKRITYWNRAAERITGYGRDEVIGRSCAENILRHIDREGNELCLAGCPLTATLGDGSFREVSVYLHHKLGYRVPVSVRVSPVRDAVGAIVGSVEVFTDNSSYLEMLQEMERLKADVFVDPLTSVGNRRFAGMTLRTRCVEQKEFNVPFGVVFLDIDHFKRFNDSFGHTVGDRVLTMVGKTVTGLVRRPDVVARWGGEEFIAILANVDGNVLARVAERIRNFISRGFIMDGESKLTVTASVGATLARMDDTPETIIARADELMYKSKEAGRNRVTIG